LNPQSRIYYQLGNKNDLGWLHDRWWRGLSWHERAMLDGEPASLFDAGK
jgi:hypothetical protein